MTPAPCGVARDSCLRGNPCRVRECLGENRMRPHSVMMRAAGVDLEGVVALLSSDPLARPTLMPASRITSIGGAPATSFYVALNP